VKIIRKNLSSLIPVLGFNIW